MKKKEILFTKHPNFTWEASGKGVCAHSSMYIAFRKRATSYGEHLEIIGAEIYNTSATGNKSTGYIFKDQREYFQPILEKLYGKAIDFYGQKIDAAEIESGGKKISVDAHINETLSRILKYGN